MAVTEQDVRHIAALARLGLAPERVPSLVGELNGILEHMAVLQQVDTTGVDPAVGVGTVAMPLREDAGPQLPLARSRDAFAPAVTDGFFVVPRLATHAALGTTPTDSSVDDALDADLVEEGE
ncbi:MAG: Asp-tRNA(Asn)/Glu-tRNA(Gln) amidotransferase subunit GatC [Gemmatimonadaceae bacterium]